MNTTPQAGTERDPTADGLVERIVIDRNSPVPLYFQVAGHLGATIESGDLAPGDFLPAEIDLAQRLSISRPTLRQAIDRLVDQGLVVRKRGIGTVVMPRPVHRPMELTSLHDDLAAAGRQPMTKVLKLETVAANTEAAAALGVSTDDQVVYIERIRHADGAPLGLMHNYLPGGLVTLDVSTLERDGLYSVLRASGVEPQIAKQTVGARAASRTEARLLEASPGLALLTIQRIAFDASGRVVEYGEHAYRADRYSFTTTLVAR
ncbi:MAG: GntR family transcriptional regulator [Acidimicrobiales bacterium]